MEVSRTTWTILAVFTLGAYFIVIVANKIADDPPQNQIPGGIDVNGTIMVKLEKLSPVEEMRKLFANSLDVDAWTLRIWNVVYAWQAFVIIYAFTLLCRRSGAEDDEYLYNTPQFWNPWFFVFYMFAFLFDVGRIITFGLGRSDFNLLFALLSTFCMCFALLFSFINLSRTQADLVKRGFYRDVVFNLSVVQNGVGFYLIQMLITAYVGFNVVLIESAELSDFHSTTISYSLMLAMLIIWFALDNFLCSRACRFFFAPYAGLVWYMLGVLIKQWDEAFATSIYGLVFIIFVLVATVTKIVLVINRSRDEPMLSEGYQRI